MFDLSCVRLIFQTNGNIVLFLTFLACVISKTFWNQVTCFKANIALPTVFQNSSFQIQIRNFETSTWRSFKGMRNYAWSILFFIFHVFRMSIWSSQSWSGILILLSWFLSRLWVKEETFKVRGLYLLCLFEGTPTSDITFKFSSNQKFQIIWQFFINECH